MSRLQLPQVTLCAVDARSPALALQSLLRSMAQIDFGRVLLFTQGLTQGLTPGFAQGLTQGFTQGLTHDLSLKAAGVELVDSGPIDSGAAYSHFVLRRLPGFIETSHVLVTQWDGFVCDASAWQPEFLHWDYIGAPWPEQPEALQVGNGGFSLRSQRLLQAGLDPAITQEHPEDVMLCREFRDLLQQRHGLKFAPLALAQRFAFENRHIAGPCFGFHGPYNLPRVLDEPTLQSWLSLLPQAFFRSRDARRLARALLAHRMPLAAQQLIARRRAAGRADANTRLLGLLAGLMRRWPV